MAYTACGNCINSATLAGLKLDCDLNFGGISEVFIASYDAAMYTLTGASTAVTAVTINNAAAVSGIKSGTSWYQYCVRKNTSSLSSSAARGDNDALVITNTLNLVFKKMDSVKRLEVQALSNADVNVIVKDKNGIYWALGVTDSVRMGDSEGVTGVQKTDANQYSINLVSEEDCWPTPLTAAAITALEGLVQN